MNQNVLEEAVLRPNQRGALAELSTSPAPVSPALRAPLAHKNVRVAIVHEWLTIHPVVTVCVTALGAIPAAGRPWGSRWRLAMRG